MNSLNNINAAITLLLNLTAAAARVSSAIAAARSEDRDLSDAELAGLHVADNAARADLVAAIEAAKS